MSLPKLELQIPSPLSLLRPVGIASDQRWNLRPETGLRGCAYFLLHSSGGKCENYILKEFSGKILYSTILTINILMSLIRKLPTTTVLKPVSRRKLHLCIGHLGGNSNSYIQIPRPPSVVRRLKGTSAFGSRTTPS